MVSRAGVAQTTAQTIVRDFGLDRVAILLHFRIAWMGRDSAKTQFNRHVSGFVATYILVIVIFEKQFAP